MSRIVMGIAGYKNSGKTTLVEKLTAEFVSRGLKVATLKHAHHTFDIDHEGTDSARHRAAGSSETLIVSDRKMARIVEFERPGDEPKLNDILASLGPCDLVLIEGWKREDHPKLELMETARDAVRFSNCRAVICTGSPSEREDGLPVFQRDQIAQIADFVAAQPPGLQELHK
jgi:molybdopterin-guanine dinucleotide biosynthesis protein B